MLLQDFSSEIHLHQEALWLPHPRAIELPAAPTRSGPGDQQVGGSIPCLPWSDSGL